MESKSFFFVAQAVLKDFVQATSQLKLYSYSTCFTSFVHVRALDTAIIRNDELYDVNLNSCKKTNQ